MQKQKKSVLLAMLGVTFASLGWAEQPTTDQLNAKPQTYFDGKLSEGSVVGLANGKTGVVLSVVEAERLRVLDQRAYWLQYNSAIARAMRRANEGMLKKDNKMNQRISDAGFYSAIFGSPALAMLNVMLETSWLPWVSLGLLALGFGVAYFAELTARLNEEKLRSAQHSWEDSLDQEIANLKT